MEQYVRIPFGLALAIVAFIATGCGVAQERGSGTAETVSYALDGFDGIDIGGTFDLQASAGKAFSIEITVDDNFVDDLEVEIKGSTLHIGFASGNRNPRTQPVAMVTAPSLDSISINGASSGTVTGIDTTSLQVEANGASQATVTGDVGDVSIEVNGASEVVLSGDSGRADIEVNGASEVVLSGDSGRVEIEANGASNVDLTRTAISEAHVDISGASALALGSTNTVTGELSGASSLEVDQDTNVSVELSGDSDVSRRG